MPEIMFTYHDFATLLGVSRPTIYQHIRKLEGVEPDALKPNRWGTKKARAIIFFLKYDLQKRRRVVSHRRDYFGTTL